jgi:hypothetical protein
LHYDEVAKELFAKNSVIKAFFPDSPFLSTTLNMGDQSVSPMHVDNKNLVFGICCIAVFGSFNHRTGGHNLMRPAKTIFELRRGDLMFLPSGSVHHGNIPIVGDGTRFVAVFYTAGALFRWVNDGHRLRNKGKKGVKESRRSKEEQSELEILEGNARWNKGMDLFSTYDELNLLL